MVNLLIKILGGGGEVGRMAIFVKDTAMDKGFLFDYGVNFDENDRPVMPGHVRPRDIMAVFLSHSHLDHCGALPSLYVTSPPPVYATPLTLELADIMFKDAIKLSGYYLPYEDEEIKAVFDHAIPITYGEDVDLTSDVRAYFLNAGHVPGSMITVLEVNGARVVFTGDFNLAPSNLLRGADLSNIPKDVDVVIMEGTYVMNTHPPREEVEREFIRVIRETVESGGSVLIPVLTIGRAQEILITLYKNGIDYPIIVDGLARIANQVVAKYPHYLADPGLYVKAVESSLEVTADYQRRSLTKEPVIIVSPAGMLKGGAAVYYLKRLGRDRKNAVILTSYQAPNTPGFELLTRGRTFIDKSEVVLEAKLYWFDFSSHSGRAELEAFIRHFNPDTRIFLVHTEAIKAFQFLDRLRDKYGIDNVHVPINDEGILISIKR
ncbi:MAG: MBL fold metallo-hydrolase [Vulcanisaeta sp.]|jgi:putative mRNA 3-end processing factor|nr:MBL fold metallo-hydrolase [Vulcanisaeta sp.]MCG2869837.1 MBL fold metallo-hydrolase [Vulcanisaeta sp.]MCG2881107.1 MBL fold metallo-hydrolase [Vulcanisaeta sp.]MCG2886983.1 MBL fold metallo-hydrolase [Vulcanisaeta sp.]MCG2892886.1 MBL fold metallo-hydrolase [Vulcanisaeta sp.]